LSRNPSLDPEQRARAVAVLEADPGDELMLPGLLRGPNRWDWPRPLPLRAIERIGLTLDFERDKQFIDDARTGTAVPGSVVLSFWSHREPKLRAWSCLYWPRMSDAVRHALLADPDPEVRARAEYSAQPFVPGDFDYSTPLGPRDEMPRIMTGDEQWRHSMLLNGCVSRGVVDHVLDGRPVDEGQRSAWLGDVSSLASNPTVPTDYLPWFLAQGCALELSARDDLTLELIHVLAVHPSPNVRRRLLVNPLLSEAERLAIDIGVSEGATGLLGMTGASMMDVQEWPPADLDRLIAQARSAIPFVRQVAAGSRFLPSEEVARLAEDDDPAVRLALCLRHPEAQASVLARTWLERPSHRRSLMTRPDFPGDVVDGLAVHADNPDPDARILATYDPDLPADVADRLSRDADRGVRAAALRHPHLPLARIREQLLAARGVDPFVEAAAANPALPVENMHRILDVELVRGGY
jgi:hypothetical protein